MNFPSSLSLERDVEGCSGFTKEELGYWGSKLLWGLKQYECPNKHLVLWDIVAALSAFKPCAPRFIKHIILQWLKLLLEDILDPPIKEILPDMQKYMSNISSRQLHLLNIFCRRVIASSGYESVKAFAKPAKLVELYGEDEQQWMAMMLNCEKELRERLLGLSLSTVLRRISGSATKTEFGLWNPVGISLMVKWVIQNQDHVSHQLRLLVSEIEGIGARYFLLFFFAAEICILFCSAQTEYN